MRIGEFREIDDDDEEDVKLYDRHLTPNEREIDLSERTLTPEEAEDWVRRHKEKFLTPEECDRIIEEYNEGQRTTKDHSEGTGTGPARVESRKVRDIVSQNESMEWNPVTITDLTEKLCRSLPETSSRVVCADLRMDSGLGPKELLTLGESFRQNHTSIEQSVRERLGLDANDRGLRIGISEGRVYIWIPSQEKAQLSKMYGEIYFYFMDSTEIVKYIDEMKDALDDGRTEDLSGTIDRLEKLMTQMFPANGKCEKINIQLIRIKGAHLEFMNDLSGKTLKELEERVARVTTASGRGGIENPRFPEGEEFDIAISRLTATIVSDCTIEPNGVIKYGEPELTRIDRVVENLRRFGDINPTSRYVEKEGHYLTHFPSAIGKGLMFLGLPAGDKTIQNPSLFPTIKDGSERVQRAYVEEMLPQDGCIGVRMIIWTRANALHAGDKTEKYGFEPKVGRQEIDLIQNHGKRSEKGHSLSWGKLDDLTMHSDKRTAQVAKDLQKIVWDNPNRLIDDETEIVRNLGVDVETKPYMIRYYPKSGRVSVAWNARTSSIKECVKLGILAPPNDTKKKEILRRILKSRPDEVESAIGEIENMGLEFDKWWD